MSQQEICVPPVVIILLRSKGQAYRKDEFASVVVKTNPDGSIVLLEDIATINDGFEETPIRTRFNGKRAAFIDVYRIGNQKRYRRGGLG